MISSFGLIDNDTVLQAILARRAPDSHREIRNEFGEEARTFIEFPDEDRDAAYAQGEKALRRAVHFLQQMAGVPHFTLLPYKYPLVVLTRLFAHYQTLDERSTYLVRRWFWRAALVGPGIFGGGTTGAVRTLNRAVQPGDLESSIQRLLDLIPKSAARVPDLQRFRSKDAITKFVLCSWWHLEPRSLTTGEPFDISDLAASIEDARTSLDAVEYVFSPYVVPREQRSWSANRTLYPADDMSELSALESILAPPLRQRPLSGVGWERALKSHSITLEMAALVERRAVAEFLTVRQEALGRQLDNFIRQQCEWEFEDTPPLDSLVIDDEEEAEELSDDSA